MLGRRQLNLYAVDAIHAVNEQDENEYEGYLHLVRLLSRLLECIALFTFNPYCSLAIIGLSEMKLKRPRFMLNGMGIMRAMNTTISKTRRAKTCDQYC